MKIYTKTGDLGTTSLLGGTRVSKSHIRIDAYGHVDELNSYIGLLCDFSVNQNRIDLLRSIQNNLFSIGSQLACEMENPSFQMPQILEEDISVLENAIDKMNETLPELRSFILPGGSQEVSFTHIARTVCRRAERQVILLNLEEKVNELIIKYLNRLSDFLFVMARMNAFELNIEEIKWNSK